jgi:hypothetical protein
MKSKKKYNYMASTSKLINKLKDLLMFKHKKLLSKYHLPIAFIILCHIINGDELKGQDQSNQASDQIIAEMVSKIRTDVDPDFIYEYEQSKFVPGDGKVLLVMGQTVERITEYMDHFSHKQLPGGWASYWGITEFKGVKDAHKNDTGSSQNHQMLVDNFPNSAIQSAMWMVGKWDVAKKAGQGSYDKVIKKYAKWAKKVKRPIYLRIGYEFDGPHNELKPREYIVAYKHIVDLLRAEGADNIAFVWHSYAAPPYQGHPVSAWYPGDDYVDWVGISVFGHAYGGEDFGSDCENVLSFAREHKKPVMIAESNPIHGIEKENNEAWDNWFVNLFNFSYKKNIKAISFISENWTETNISGISEWKDSRLVNNEVVAKAWFQETNKDRYLKQSKGLFKQLGYKR